MLDRAAINARTGVDIPLIASARALILATHGSIGGVGVTGSAIGGFLSGKYSAVSSVMMIPFPYVPEAGETLGVAGGEVGAVGLTADES